MVQLVLARQLVGPGLRLALGVPVGVQSSQFVSSSIGVELSEHRILGRAQTTREHDGGDQRRDRDG